MARGAVTAAQLRYRTDQAPPPGPRPLVPPSHPAHHSQWNLVSYRMAAVLL